MNIVSIERSALRALIVTASRLRWEEDERHINADHWIDMLVKATAKAAPRQFSTDEEDAFAYFATWTGISAGGCAHTMGALLREARENKAVKIEGPSLFEGVTA